MRSPGYVEVRFDGTAVPPDCFHEAITRKGLDLYVSQDGFYKFGSRGKPVRAHGRSRVNLLLPGSKKLFRAVCLKRVFASTFGSVCEPYRHSDCVRYASEPHLPLEVHKLAWVRQPDRNGYGSSQVSSPEVLPGEQWAHLPSKHIAVSSMNRYKRDGSSNVMQFVPGAFAGKYFRVSVENAQYQFHRLVAEAFLGPPKGDRVLVDHRDGNTHNNSPSNLSWVTFSENNANRRPVLNASGSDSGKLSVYYKAIVAKK